MPSLVMHAGASYLADAIFRIPPPLSASGQSTLLPMQMSFMDAPLAHPDIFQTLPLAHPVESFIFVAELCFSSELYLHL